MIITRTPFRISFAGGGSDFREYYRQEGGAVLSVTIDKYVYLSMHPLFHQTGYFLKYSHSEMVDEVSHIQHPIIKTVFSKHGIVGVDFNSSSDVPAGTGLGSSSSFTVGLINLCYSYNNQFRNEMSLAKEACEVELDDLNSPIGKQDQYAAAVGGLNFIRFNQDDSVTIEKIHMKLNEFDLLGKSLMLFYLGGTRSATFTLQEQTSNIEKNRPTLRKMVDLAGTLRDELKSNRLENVGPILNANWQYKRELASTITNSMVDEIYAMALWKGASGGKLLGAGSTGFLLLVVPPEQQQDIRQTLELYELPFTFDNSGTTVIY